MVLQPEADVKLEERLRPVYMHRGTLSASIPSGHTRMETMDTLSIVWAAHPSLQSAETVLLQVD